MGYYNDITAVVYPSTNDSHSDAVNKYGQLKVLMATRFAGVAEAFSGWVWDDERLIVKMDCNTKWSAGGYPECKEFMFMLEELEELGYCYEFLRIGEEFSDIEEQYSEGYYGVLDVRREIDYDPPNPTIRIA